MEERRCARCNKLLFKEFSGGIQIEHGIDAHRNSRSLGVEIICPRCDYVNVISYDLVVSEDLVSKSY